MTDTLVRPSGARAAAPLMGRGTSPKSLAFIDPAAWERCGRAEAAEHDSLVSVLGAWRQTMSGQARE